MRGKHWPCQRQNLASGEGLKSGRLQLDSASRKSGCELTALRISSPELSELHRNGAMWLTVFDAAPRRTGQGSLCLVGGGSVGPAARRTWWLVPVAQEPCPGVGNVRAGSK